MAHNIPLSAPDITEAEIDAVVAVLRSGILSIGPAIEQFEQLIAQQLQTRYAVAVNSGTSALHLLIRAFGIREGDEVITTPFSFVASANCILFERARPVFVDIDPLTYHLDLNRIAEALTPRTRAILAVDIFGQPADILTLRRLTEGYQLAVIEDACEALGSKYEGMPAGSLADAAACAFYPNKQITTGEGGVIVTNDGRIAELCRSMRNQGRADKDCWLVHERLGYNYRLSELHAALGVAQLRRLDEIIARRQQIAQGYMDRLADVQEVLRPWISPKVTRMSWQLFVVETAEDIDRDSVIHYLQKKGIGCKPYFPPIHLQPFYVQQFGYKPGDFPVTERIAQHTIALPFHNRLTDGDLDYVTTTLKTACKRFRKTSRVSDSKISRDQCVRTRFQWP